MKKAFSLVELSIVLIIIGLLVGGITNASKLILQAKLKSAQAMTDSTEIWEIQNDNLEMAAVLWYDALDADSITKDSSNAVSAWSSKVSDKRFYELKQSTASLKPTYVYNGMNGYPTINFAGDRLALTTMPILDTDESYTVAVALSVAVTNASHGSFISLSSTNLRIRWDSLLGFYNGVNGEPRAYNYKIGKSQFYLITVDDSAGSDSVVTEYYLDNQGPAGGELAGSPTISNTGLTVGTTTNTNISEIIIFDKTLDAEEIGIVREYFLKKYDIN